MIGRYGRSILFRLTEVRAEIVLRQQHEYHGFELTFLTLFMSNACSCSFTRIYPVVAFLVLNHCKYNL